ncbi:MAG: right-handed parallel beta-helix repeat-containing protein [Hyphomicrobiales bacterium]|nr:right-handed parallel beta-helix repeat-containing protein [Hyphomicrobiales bacterium]
MRSSSGPGNEQGRDLVLTPQDTRSESERRGEDRRPRRRGWFSRFLTRYLILVGVLAHVAAAAGAVAVYRQVGYLGGALDKGIAAAERAVPPVGRVLRQVANESGIVYRHPDAFPPIALKDVEGLVAGARADGRPSHLATPAVSRPAALRVVRVSNGKELVAAVKDARAGDDIVLAPGTYGIKARYVDVARPGESNFPITLRAEKLGTAEIRFDALEGFLVRAPHWTFENLVIRGVCKDHSACEHGFHVVGQAHHTTIRNNRVIDFNAHFKINGGTVGKTRHFPDDGVLEGNSIFNTSVRRTNKPVTPIDLVAASNWQIRDNLIADFEKGGGDRISYAAFVKGAGEDSVMEGNLVICRMSLRGGGGIQLGLSLGGGGTNRGSCRDGKCGFEYKGGVIRNNVIMRCPKDVGIYLNKAADSVIANNALLGTMGIDVRFQASSATVVNNVLDSHIRERNGGKVKAVNNLVLTHGWWPSLMGEKTMDDVFEDGFDGRLRLRDIDPIVGRGSKVPGLERDLCGNGRAADPDLGPIEYKGKKTCLLRADDGAGGG